MVASLARLLNTTNAFGSLWLLSCSIPLLMFVLHCEPWKIKYCALLKKRVSKHQTLLLQTSSHSIATVTLRGRNNHLPFIAEGAKALRGTVAILAKRLILP